MLILTSGASVIGDGMRWGGDVKSELHKTKRVVWCKHCHSPIDFHALLLGKLNLHAYPINIGALVIVLGAIACKVLGLSFWPSLGIGVAAGWLVGFALNRIERQRLSDYRLTESQVKDLTGK